MSQMDRTAGTLEDAWTSLKNEWQAVQDVWLDANCTDFENSFWIEIDGSVRTALADFRRFSETAQRAQDSMES